jgi:transposase InsO family protein
MPWNEATVMSERAKMAAKWSSGMYSATDLAQEFGVSRPTVYALIRRIEADPDEALAYRPPIARSCPHRTSDEVVEQIVAAKQQHELWGPAKLIDLLKHTKPEVVWPAPSTAGRILEGRGLVKKRKPRRNGLLRRYVQRPDAQESGSMMTADHKGQIRMENGRYCYPVTVCDPVSRFVYAIAGKTSTSYLQARATFERIFEEYGVPDFLLTDNGNPFSCSRALGALSRLAVWWIKLGITPLTIHKGCPWENGSHERMHKTLKAEVRQNRASSMRKLQKIFDHFRDEYNGIRPHQGLGGRRPADLIQPCKRPYPSKLQSVEYPLNYEVRSVRSKGEIKWRSHRPFIGQSLIGERVGLVEIDDGIWSIYFSTIELGRYDQRTKNIT